MAFSVVGRGRSSLLGALAVVGALAGCAQPASERLERQTGSIIDGKLDTSDKGVVSLLRRVQGGYFPSCSGTLIAPNLVLTARHCVADLNSEDGESVTCGATTFGPPQSASLFLVSVEANVGQDGLDPYGVSQVLLPPQVDSRVCGQDIALLLLARSGVPSGVAASVAPRLDREMGTNEVFKAVGYGLQDPADQNGETVGHRMAVSDAQVFCAGSACGVDFVTRGEWIADSPVCSGDSGGPALDQDGRVGGVTSRGDEACTIGIYTSVYAWRDFLTEAAFDAAEAGGYAPPEWAGEPPPDFTPGMPEPNGGSGAGGSGSGNAGSSAAGGSGNAGSSASGDPGGSPTLAGSGNLGEGSGIPTVDPLGLSCTERCPGQYKCWAASGEPPGICVPPCGPSLAACPREYSCSEDVGECVPTRALAKPDTTSDESSGCSLSSTAGGADSTWLALGTLSAAFWLGRRKRLSGRARSGA